MTTTADVAETAVIFLGLNSLSLTVLLAAGKLHTRKPRRPKTTAARAETEDALSAQAAGNGFALLTPVPGVPATAGVAAAVADAVERRARRLPPLPPVGEMRHPSLAEYARSRPRDPRTGQFVKQHQVAS